MYNVTSVCKASVVKVLVHVAFLNLYRKKFQPLLINQLYRNECWQFNSLMTLVSERSYRAPSIWKNLLLFFMHQLKHCNSKVLSDMEASWQL
jgi:hypothetical protein